MVPLHEGHEGLRGDAELRIGAPDDGLDGLEEARVDLRGGRVGRLLDQPPHPPFLLLLLHRPGNRSDRWPDFLPKRGGPGEGPIPVEASPVTTRYVRCEGLRSGKNGGRHAGDASLNLQRKLQTLSSDLRLEGGGQATG